MSARKQSQSGGRAQGAGMGRKGSKQTAERGSVRSAAKRVMSKLKAAEPAPLARRGAAKRRPKASEVGARTPLRALPTQEEHVDTKPGMKSAQKRAAQGRGTARAKSTRVANPKRSTTDQASKRGSARRVDGRLAR